MRLHIKFLLMIAGVIVSLIILVTVALRGFVYPTFSAIESAQTKKDVLRVRAAIESELQQLLQLNRDWSVWSDTYSFLEGRYPGYVEANLGFDTMENLRQDVFILFDTKAQPAYKGFATESIRLAEANSGLEFVLTLPSNPGHPLVSRDISQGSLTGILATPYGLLLSAASPIVRNDYSGPAIGTLLVGRFLSGDLLEVLRAQTESDFTMHIGKNERLEIAIEAGLAESVKGFGAQFVVETDDVVYSYLSVDDVFGKQVAWIEVASPRDVLLAGQSALFTTILALMLASAAILLASGPIVRRYLSGPLKTLNQHVTTMREEDDLSQRLDDKRRDEIGDLARAFNALSQALHESRVDLTEARDEAVQLAKHKSDFLATMSHEIRTPLNGVLGMTELLLGTPLDEQQQRFTQTAHQSGEMLLSVINDILDFSKIESDKLALDDTPMDVRDIIEDIGVIFAPSAQRKGIELLCATAPADMHSAYSGDPVRLRQILANLVSNAIKFTEHGEIALIVSPLGSCDGDEGVQFTVRDTGIGIAEDAIEHIFESFSQEDRSTTRKFGGTGLGLAIAKLLANLMDGDISVSSTQGKGSQFTVRVKLKRIEAKRDTTHQNRVLRTLEGVRALVVDDNATNREILEHQLASWQFKTTAVVDADNALRVLDSQARANTGFGIAIIDFDMPGIDGAQLIESIAQDTRYDNMKIIMLSSVDLSMQERNRVRERVSSFLVKPARQAALLGAISEALSRASINTKTEKSVVSKSDQPARHVLLAEDNPVNQRVAKEMLARLNCTCDIASDGQKAIDCVGQATYDLVLMDCNMPVCDGFLATEAIRKSGEFSDLPIVALTANALEGDRKRCLDAGMDDYMSKPFTFAQLVAVLEKWSPNPHVHSDVAPSVVNE